VMYCVTDRAIVGDRSRVRTGASSGWKNDSGASRAITAERTASGSGSSACELVCNIDTMARVRICAALAATSKTRGSTDSDGDVPGIKQVVGAGRALEEVGDELDFGVGRRQRVVVELDGDLAAERDEG
jgi:hypothetical protein